MIPKVIHYCWFGKEKKPKLIRDCIKSWKLHLSDYQIVEWNESNSDFSHPFVKKCLELKKWAFVSDYVRLKVLLVQGGIYLDTDMMVIKSLDNFLSNDCFIGAEDNRFLNCAIVGSLKGNMFIKNCLSQYDDIKPQEQLDFGNISIPKIASHVFKTTYQYQDLFNSVKRFENLTIYPSDYFYPLPINKKKEFRKYKKYIGQNTYAIHLWKSSWFNQSEFDYIRKRHFYTAFKLIFYNFLKARNINIKYLKKVLYSIKESFKN